MISTAAIASLSLNLSLVIYLTNYIPQLLHNHRSTHISNLSSYFHALLFISYFADLLYGFGCQLPWQYKLVSISGVFYLYFQHRQLKPFLDSRVLLWTNIILFFLMALFIIFYVIDKSFLFTLFGYIAEAAGVACALPQIIKNIGTAAALSLSASYLGLKLISEICDNISAHLLSWPLPSKIGAAISMILCLVMIHQLYRARILHSQVIA